MRYPDSWRRRRQTIKGNKNKHCLGPLWARLQDLLLPPKGLSCQHPLPLFTHRPRSEALLPENTLKPGKASGNENSCFLS